MFAIKKTKELGKWVLGIDKLEEEIKEHKGDKVEIIRIYKDYTIKLSHIADQRWDTINDLEQKNQKLNQENESLRDELEAGLKIKQVQENQLTSEREKVSSLETKLNEKDEKIAKTQIILKRIKEGSKWWKDNCKASQLSEQQTKNNYYNAALELITARQKIARLTINQHAWKQQMDDYKADLSQEKQKRQQAEQEKDNYLNELNELDKDFSEQEQLLADKNTKLSQNNNLKQENNTLQGKLTYYEDQDNKLRGTIQDLQNQINNHTCPSCPLIHLPEPHECPIVNQTDCSHSDYDTLKSNLKTTQTERDQALQEKENYQNQLTNQEQQIIQRLNTTFNLGLSSQEKDLNQAILKIQALIDKPPLIMKDETIQQELEQAQQTIINLEKELAEQATPFGKELETIKEIDLKGLEKELNIKLSSEIKEQIQQATTYQQLSQMRNSEIKKHLGQSLNNLVVNQPKEIIQQPKQERTIWISLLLVSLLTIGGLLVRLRRINKQKKKSSGIEKRSMV